MTKTELSLLDALFTRGIVTVMPNSIEHKTAFRLCNDFGLIERETAIDSQVVYQYRVNVAAFSPSVLND